MLDADTAITARPIAADDPDLVASLGAAGLPTEDLADGKGSFFAFALGGRAVGYAGFELHGEDALLRSVVVLQDMRGRGHGRSIARETLARAGSAGARRAYLLTTTAEAFFTREGFVPIDRGTAPAAILATRQATTICASAPLLMKPLPPPR